MLWIAVGAATVVVAWAQKIDTDQRRQAALREVEEQRQRVVNVTYLPWLNPLCGIGHDRPECYQQAWSGGVYPTSPLRGEAGMGVEWTCTIGPQTSYGRVRTCAASAGTARLARYACHPAVGTCKGGADAFRRLAIANNWPYSLRR